MANLRRGMASPPPVPTTIPREILPVKGLRGENIDLFFASPQQGDVVATYCPGDSCGPVGVSGASGIGDCSVMYVQTCAAV